MRITQATLDAIPYLRLHGVQLLEAGGGRAWISLPDRPELRNHVGIASAGALFTLAEAAGGVAAATTTEDGTAVLLRGADVRYLRPGEGEVTAVGRVDEAHADEARRGYRQSLRAELTAQVSVADADGAELLSGSYDYAVREARA